MIADSLNDRSENNMLCYGLYDEVFTVVVEEAERRADLGFKTAQFIIEEGQFKPEPDYKILAHMLTEEGFDVRVWTVKNDKTKMITLGWGDKDAPEPGHDYI